jgi:Sulfotransferase domain
METTRNNSKTSAWNLGSVGNHLLSLPERVLDVLAMGAMEARNLIRLYRGKWFLYQPRPDDIFVVSYPKSGTTLMQMIVYQLATRGEIDFPHITIVSPWLEMELMRAKPRGLEVPSPRVLKSHLRYPMLPKVGRFIYMLRDPRDVAFSAYHHHVMMTGERPRPERFMHRFILGRSAFQSWFKHVASWWPHRNDPNVLFLRYEEVVADLEGAVRRVAAFCDLELHEEDLPKILEHCGIDFMKRHQEKFDPRTRQAVLNSGQFIRQGKTGSGREVMTPETQEILVEKLAHLERRLGVPARDPLSGVFRLRD